MTMHHKRPTIRFGRKSLSPLERLAAIAFIIEGVDHREMCADGPISPTRQAITDEEFRRIYKLAKGDQEK